MPIAGPPIAGPGGPTPPEPEERIAVTWTAPDGTVWPLTVPRGDVRAQATDALGAAVPVEVTTDPNPRGGATVRHVQPIERYLILPILVRGRTHQEFVERWRAVGRAFTQTKWRGPGVLRVQRPDGSAREISAQYVSGWAGRPEHGWTWDVADALTLLAPDPYWLSTEEVEITRQFQATGLDFYDEFMTIVSSAVLGESTVVNQGDAIAWPVWTVTGPLDQLTATNHTTGQTFVLDPDWDGGGSLGPGETVTIQTDPVRVRGPNGEIWTGAITGPLWGLDPGESEVEFTASGADEGTSVVLRFRLRYETA